MRHHLIRLAASVALFIPVSSSAQLTSDVVPRQRLVARDEQIRLDLENASRRLGPFRLQPQLLFRDLGYNNNVFGASEDQEPVADWTASVAAGARWTLPVGPKMYVRGLVLPEYTWYADLADRRFLGGTYNASILGLFNRLSVEATGGTSKNLSLVSSEIEAPAIRRLNDVSLDVELDILRRLSIFGSVQGQNHAYTSEAEATDELARVAELDRDDRAIRAGVRYRFTSSLDFSLAAEETESEFERSPLLRDNSSTATLLGVHYNRERVYANITVGSREGKALNGSSFPEYETTTGSYFISYSLVAPFEVQAYGQRHVVYGLFAQNPYFFESRLGGALVYRLGERAAFRVYGDSGTNDYEVPVLVGNVPVQRADDARTFGGSLTFRLYRNVSLVVGASQSDYESNIPDFNRSVVRIQSGITFAGGTVR